MEMRTVATPMLDSLPSALHEIPLRHLFAMRLESGAPIIVGQTPGLFRRVGFITGGTFESRIDGLHGTIVPGGNDWQSVRPDGATTLHVRIILETAGGDRIAMTYPGIRHGRPEVLSRLDLGDVVEPSEYYFRITPIFETASERFSWLNRIVALGTGYRLPGGPVYNVFEAL